MSNVIFFAECRNPIGVCVVAMAAAIAKNPDEAFAARAQSVLEGLLSMANDGEREEVFDFLHSVENQLRASRGDA